MAMPIDFISGPIQFISDPLFLAFASFLNLYMIPGRITAKVCMIPLYPLYDFGQDCMILCLSPIVPYKRDLIQRY